MDLKRIKSLWAALLIGGALFGACGYSEEEMQAQKDQLAATQAKLSESEKRGTPSTHSSKSSLPRTQS